MRYHVIGSGDPVIFWGTMFRRENQLEEMTEMLQNLGCTVVLFEADDWNRDFSPWQYGEFAGEARETLKTLENTILSQFGDRTKVIAGYSLAGLFALWAAHESDDFSGCICCSGSLWYEGWMDYAKEHNLKEDMKAYLSLGGKEKNTKNPVMAKVENITKWQSELLKEKGIVSTFVLNPGGHFKDTDKRVIQGIEWMKGQLK